MPLTRFWTPLPAFWRHPVFWRPLQAFLRPLPALGRPHRVFWSGLNRSGNPLSYCKQDWICHRKCRRSVWSLSIFQRMRAARFTRKAEKYKYGWSVDDHTLKCLRGEKCTNYGFTRPCCRPKQSKDRCSIWHFPPAEDSVLAERYARCKTFCIIRNPLGRFISEYKWHILRWSKGSKNKRHKNLICSPAALENYFEEVKRGGRLNFADDCHLLPQVKYVFSNDLQRLHCNHVLRFENLTSEFNAIMKAYRLAIRLEDGNEGLHKHYYAIPCKITLTEEMKSWIYETYRQDFELFGYSMA